MNNKKSLKKLEKVAYVKTIKNYLNLVFIILVVILWFSHIQNFLLSLVAIAAAIVIATKELIMSLIGGSLAKFNGLYKAGDRIEINGIRGFVIEKGLAVTKILEVGPEKNSQQTTGNMVSFPNSVILTTPIKNESYFKGYSIKTYTFKLPPDKSYKNFETEMLELGNTICSEYLGEAKKYIESFCTKEGLSTPKIEPRCKVALDDDNNIELLLKMPVRNHEIADVEQVLLRRYIDIL